MNTKFNLQRFAAETGTTTAADLEPAISIDLASRLTENIETLQKIISTNEMIPMAVGTVIKMCETKVKGNVAGQVPEGDTIKLTEVERKEKKKVEITLNKYRKQTTAEAIQRVGRDVAINQTDEALVKALQKEIKKSFFNLIATGTGTAKNAGTGLQGALAAAWGKVQELFDDVDATPIYFISSTDVASYLGNAQVTMQTAFGMSYIENFLGLGDAFISPALEAGNVIATAKENLNCAYIPATGEVGSTFGMTSDETALIGITHALATDRLSVDTVMMSGIKFYPEYLDKIVKVPVAAATGE